MPGFGRVRRCLTLATGLVECLCFAGVVFGWASLAFVFKQDNYFSSLCVNVTGVNATQKLDCSEQDKKLSLVFTIASFMNNFLVLPSGFLFDRFGTTVTRLYGICLYTVATVMLALSSSAMDILVFPALSFLAVSGMLLLMTNMQVGNLFDSHRSTIITLYNGAFDSGSAVFLIIKLLHDVGVSVWSCFVFLSVCSVTHVLRTFFLLPRKFIPYPLPGNYTYGITCGKPMTPTSIVAMNANRMKTHVDVKQERTFCQCVLSWFFVLNLFWMSVIQLRIYLFIGTLNPMLQRLAEGEPSLVSQYTNAFGITQLCAVLFAPWNGIIIDRLKHKYRRSGLSDQERDLQAVVVSLFLAALQCVLFSICAAIPFLPLQYLTFVLQVLNRAFIYGSNVTFLSVAFPSCHFGKLYGLTNCLSAVVAALQYPCFALVKGVLAGDPLYLNIGLTLLCLLTFVHPIYLYLHCRRVVSRPSQS